MDFLSLGCVVFRGFRTDGASLGVRVGCGSAFIWVSLYGKIIPQRQPAGDNVQASVYDSRGSRAVCVKHRQITHNVLPQSRFLVPGWRGASLQFGSKSSSGVERRQIFVQEVAAVGIWMFRRPS